MPKNYAKFSISFSSSSIPCFSTTWRYDACVCVCVRCWCVFFYLFSWMCVLFPALLNFFSVLLLLVYTHVLLFSLSVWLRPHFDSDPPSFLINIQYASVCLYKVSTSIRKLFPYYCCARSATYVISLTHSFARKADDDDEQASKHTQTHTHTHPISFHSNPSITFIHSNSIPNILRNYIFPI